MKKTSMMAILVTLASAVMAVAQVTNAPVAPTNTVAPVVTVPPAVKTNEVPPAVTSSVPAKVVSVPPAVAPDPRVGKVLMALASHLQAAKHFRCEVSFLINSEMEGMKQEISAAYALAVEKPNRLALRYLKGMSGNTVVCNGKTLVTYVPTLNRYEEKEAPKSFEQLSQGVGPMSGNMLFVDNLLRDDIYATIMEGVVTASYVGRESVDGVECERLKFEQDQFDWEIWVTTGLKPVVIQVLSDMAKGLGSAVADGGAPKDMKMTVLNRFSRWVVDGELPQDAFEFKPPAGAKKAESLFEGEDEEPLDRPVVVVPDDGKSTNVMERK